MKKILAVAMATILCFSLVACTASGNEADKQIDRLVVVHREGVDAIVVDKETGVMYLWCKAGYGGGLSVMLDADGKPLIYEGDYDG